MLRARAKKQNVVVVTGEELDNDIAVFWGSMQNEVVQLTLAYFTLMFRKEESTTALSLKETADVFAEVEYRVPALVKRMQYGIFNDLVRLTNGKTLQGKLGVGEYINERSVQCSNWDQFLERLLRCSSFTYLDSRLRDVKHVLESLIGLAAHFLFEDKSDSDEDQLLNNKCQIKVKDTISVEILRKINYNIIKEKHYEQRLD